MIEMEKEQTQNKAEKTYLARCHRLDNVYLYLAISVRIAITSGTFTRLARLCLCGHKHDQISDQNRESFAA